MAYQKHEWRYDEATLLPGEEQRRGKVRTLSWHTVSNFVMVLALAFVTRDSWLSFLGFRDSFDRDAAHNRFTLQAAGTVIASSWDQV